eukprot:1161795-Pelagomonas_calceolata.AAC.9
MDIKAGIRVLTVWHAFVLQTRDMVTRVQQCGKHLFCRVLTVWHASDSEADICAHARARRARLSPREGKERLLSPKLGCVHKDGFSDLQDVWLLCNIWTDISFAFIYASRKRRTLSHTDGSAETQQRPCFGELIKKQERVDVVEA